jgi:glycosyltransferase involved in cell wall biosynthesis
MDKQCIVVTNPMIAANKSAQVTLNKFLRVMSACYEQITVIGGNIAVEADLEQVNVVSVPIQRAKSRWKRVLDILLLQFKIAQHVGKFAQKGVPAYFWMADKMLLPFWSARRKKSDIRFFIYGNVLKEGNPSRFRQLSGKLIAYMANHAGSVCVESPGVLREWESVVTPKQVRIIHLYTRTEDWAASDRRENVIGMLCRLTEGKHVLPSIRAFSEFHKTHPQYTLEIIGSGKQEDACRELIAQLQADAYIRMLGWVDHQEVAKTAAHWQYLLFPSDTEGMPNSVIEMMGMGIPAIASPVGGVSDIIQHGRNGWLLGGTTQEDILASLCAALAQGEGYLSMAQAAKADIGQTFSLQNAQATALRNI